jgi:F-type H+-transporting ATPase subunit delta
MKISKEAKRLARSLFQASLTNGRLDAQRSAQLADRLIAEKPRGYFSALQEYTRLVRLELDRRHALVETASPLDPVETAKLQKELPAQFGEDISLEFRVNPALLGGMRVKVGSDVWDGSVNARLAALSH